MSEIIEFTENTKKNERSREFKNKFQDKAAVEERIGAEIDAMTSINAADRNRLKRVFTGGGGQPGLVDALFAFDR
jgi:hypothetical protein